MQKADSEVGGSPLIGGCLFKERSPNNLAKQKHTLLSLLYSKCVTTLFESD